MTEPSPSAAPADPLPSTGRVDRIVVIRGAAGGLMVAMLAALVNVVAAEQDPKPNGVLVATFVGLLVGFALAGFVAGYEARHDTVRHGAWAGVAAFVPVEVVGLLARTDRGDRISIPGIVLLGFLAAICGLAAAPGGARLKRRHLAKAALKAEVEAVVKAKLAESHATDDDRDVDRTEPIEGTQG
jgi:hypothetical protein